jgi:hypothetical protein
VTLFLNSSTSIYIYIVLLFIYFFVPFTGITTP